MPTMFASPRKEFPSAVEAVRSAVEFQTLVAELTASDGDEKRIALRVGINVGDVIVEPHDLFGASRRDARGLYSNAAGEFLMYSAASHS
jgi:class 3 adenylate cyclase